MNRFPALRKAFTSMQSTFGDVAEPTDDDVAFITRVRGAPLLIWGRLQRNGRAYLVPTAAKKEDATEAAIADLTSKPHTRLPLEESINASVLNGGDQDRRRLSSPFAGPPPLYVAFT